MSERIDIRELVCERLGTTEFLAFLMDWDITFKMVASASSGVDENSPAQYKSVNVEFTRFASIEGTILTELAEFLDQGVDELEMYSERRINPEHDPDEVIENAIVVYANFGPGDFGIEVK